MYSTDTIVVTDGSARGISDQNLFHVLRRGMVHHKGEFCIFWL